MKGSFVAMLKQYVNRNNLVLQSRKLQETYCVPMPRHLRVLGLLLVTIVLTTNILVHGIVNILWLCNISALLAGIALLLGVPYFALTGAAWMIIGMVSWFLNVQVNNMYGEVISYFTHFTFGVVAVFIFFRFSVTQNLWMGCFGWYLLMQLLSRLFTVPADNVDIAFSIWPGLEPFFRSYFYFWCFVTSACWVFLFGMNKIIYSYQKK